MTETIIKAIRGQIMDVVDDPAVAGEDAVRFFDDGLLLLENGKVKAFGEAKTLLAQLPAGTDVEHFKHHLIIPGLIDTHIHFPQTEMIAAYGEQLLSWLEKYTFPTEKQFEDEAYAAKIADFFLNELLKNGTTTALVFGTVHPQSVEALFSEAQRRRLRLIAGKVMMDRNCPDYLQDTPETSYTESKALIDKWHGVDRLSYAVTPRFAPTSTPEQLAAAKRLLEEYPDVYMHTHLSENPDECAWVAELFPESTDYLGVYEDAGLVRKRAIFAHGIHLSDREYQCLHETEAAISHCPTSNLFIGSGLFNLKKCEEHGVHVGMGTDVGAGSSFSLLQTYNEAYKMQQLQGVSLSAFKGLYLNTLGGARALDLEGCIGNFNTGCEADFIVLDKKATPLLELRTEGVTEPHDLLFALMMLGDDRTIAKTYVMGDVAHDRDQNN